MSVRSPSAVGATVARVPGIRDVIRRHLVRTVFQPIVELGTAVVGYEALSRGPAGSALESTGALFGAASAAGLRTDLDWVCRGSALRAALAADVPSNRAARPGRPGADRRRQLGRARRRNPTLNVARTVPFQA